METTKEPAHQLPKALSKKTIEVKIDAKCPICREDLFNKETKQLRKSVLNSKELGAVHDGCFVPYMGEKNIRMLLQIRCYSLGDTITMTPILRELRRLYPLATIDVMTYYPDIFKNNPHVNGILDLKNPIPQEMIESYHFRLDGFDPEKLGHFSTHSVEFAAMCAMGKSILPTSWGYEMVYTKEDHDAALKVLADAGIDPEKDRCIMIHPHGTEWRTRDWGPARFPELVKKIAARWPKHKIVGIGGSRSDAPKYTMKNYVEIPGIIDLYGKLKLLETAAMMDMKCMKMLVTPDTGTLHIGATRPELPIVGIFTLIKAYFRTPVRNGRFGYKFIGIEPESGCNCTYDSKFITEDLLMNDCPMATMLQRVQWVNVPKAAKLGRLASFDRAGGWDRYNEKKDGKIGAAIKRREKEFQPGNLPCFPSVDRVMLACEAAMAKWGGDAG